MTQAQAHKENGNFLHMLKDLLNLRADTDKEATINNIKSNIEFRSANAWTLVFAILIASVGLNVNSTAVIIGAMLISPLMGPIVGSGFALGTYDFVLLKRSAKNLAAAVMISLLASTTYFLLSPLSEVQSELLARTRPSFFDVLIAFFGGAVGIIAISRKERGNAVPGVAIATALMPPLCTAGFGLASKNWSYFFGAMYLFVINSVFISISTFIFVRYLKFYEVESINPEQQRHINRWITGVGAIVILPSFFMAWYLQRESTFKDQANRYIAQEFRAENIFVVDRNISFSLKSPKVKISLLGDAMTKEEIEMLKSKANNYSIPPEIVEIRQSTLSENLEKKIGEKLSAAEGQANQMQLQIKKYEHEVAKFKALAMLSKKLTAEASAFLPGKIASIYVMGDEMSESDGTHEAFDPQNMKVLINWKTAPNKPDRLRVKTFVKERLEVDPSRIIDVRSL